ncbi:MAG: triose-phosphate isomerase [Patescibacteria group bacterium]
MKALIVANWKMNPSSLKEAKKLFEATKKAATVAKGVSVIVAPPSIFLRDISAPTRGGKVGLAAQNVHYEAGGAFTGEISVPQVRDAKAAYVIVGHAERRATGETNDDTRRKVAAVLAVKMKPILCIGEKTRGSTSAEHLLFVREQLLVGLADVPLAKLSKLIIAYEPVWAIGAPKPMQPRDMHEMSIYIKKVLVEKFGETGMNATILYGGAVDATNAAHMLREGDVKGFLVGRASVDAQGFTELLRAAAAA